MIYLHNSSKLSTKYPTHHEYVRVDLGGHIFLKGSSNSFLFDYSSMHLDLDFILDPGAPEQLVPQ